MGFFYSERETVEKEIKQIFTKEGVEHWIEKIKEILEIPNVTLFRYLESEDCEEVLKNVKSRLEKRALLKVFQKLIPLRYEHQTVKATNEGFDNDVRDVMREAGLDDKVWVSKLREWFGIGDLRLLENYEKPQFEEFLKHVDNSAQNLALRVVFSKLTNIDMLRGRVPEGTGIVTMNHIPEEERPLTEGAYAMEREQVNWDDILRSVQGGLLARGFYFSRRFEKLDVQRNFVINMSKNLEYKVVNAIHPVFHHEFTSQKTWEIFDKHLDKHIRARSVSVGANVWGLDIAEIVRTQRNTLENENFACCVNYQMIAVRCIQLKPSEMELRVEVIKSLQEIERYLEPSNYQSPGHFRDFFHKFGTHVNNGVIELGGTVRSTAYCRGFQDKDLSNVSDLVSEASETALYLSLSNEVRTNIPLNAYEVLGKTSQMCAEDLQNITVTVHRIGGPEDTTDQEIWKARLDNDMQLLRVIRRDSPPLPIWKLLHKHAKDFNNVDKLAETMLQEWRRETATTDAQFRELFESTGDRLKYLDEINAPPAQKHTEDRYFEEALEVETMEQVKPEAEKVREQETRRMMAEEIKRREEIEKLAMKIFQREEEERRIAELRDKEEEAMKLVEKWRKEIDLKQGEEEEKRKTEKLSQAEELRKTEEERKRKEEEERMEKLRKAEEERKRKEEEERMEELRKAEEERKRKEEEERMEELRKAEEERKRKEEEERMEELRKAEEERKRKEEEERMEELRKAEKERKRKEEEERMEELRKAKEERKRREEEERMEELRKAEEERKRKEEEERMEELRKAEEERKRREEEERMEELRKAEEERKRKEEEERIEELRKIEEERKRKEEELKRAEEKRIGELKKAEEEQRRREEELKRAEEERIEELRKAEEERIIREQEMRKAEQKRIDRASPLVASNRVGELIAIA